MAYNFGEIKGYIKYH